jgi:VacB/RNase II family 3'-5' exoribonuclease
MTDNKTRMGRNALEAIARRAMVERGFWPDFSQNAISELENLPEINPKSPKDLRHLTWASIDNPDSRDLDQLTVAESRQNGISILVAVADVDALVKKDSAIDAHARHNTTSVYTTGGTFPMLPEKLSTDLTSLNLDQDRAAIVVEMLVDSEGDVEASEIYPAVVRNHARLNYGAVAAWLEAREESPGPVAPEILENLRMQEHAAQVLRARRVERGALELETLETRPVFDGDDLRDLEDDEPNRATRIIEDLMIAANDATASFLRRNSAPSLRRVVRAPKRWDRIVEIARQRGFRLPPQPDPRALSEFLKRQKGADSLRFPDLSLTIVKLLGSGEYVVELPGERTPGHFGLAVKDYMHSTAPNRRFPDLITQRILKAILDGQPPPYSQDELFELARHCTEQEDDADKISRLVEKSAAAMLLSSRVGETFDALCTGINDTGTWVRIFHPPVEGKLLRGYKGVDVGDRLQVRLVNTDVDKGFIDFEKLRENPEPVIKARRAKRVKMYRN